MRKLTREELSKLIYEVTNEVIENNKSIFEEGEFTQTVEAAIVLSCAANIKLLQRLGLIDDNLKLLP